LFEIIHYQKFLNINVKGGGHMSISIGGLFLLALICAVVAIGVKVNNNTQKIQEIDNLLSK
jgi:hypothetical protein